MDDEKRFGELIDRLMNNWKLIVFWAHFKALLRMCVDEQMEDLSSAWLGR